VAEHKGTGPPMCISSMAKKAAGCGIFEVDLYIMIKKWEKRASE